MHFLVPGDRRNEDFSHPRRMQTVDLFIIAQDFTSKLDFRKWLTSVGDDVCRLVELIEVCETLNKPRHNDYK